MKSKKDYLIDNLISDYPQYKADLVKVKKKNVKMTKELAKKIGFGSIKNLWTQATEAYNWKEYERAEMVKAQERQKQNLLIKNWSRRMKKYTGGGKETKGWKKEAFNEELSIPTAYSGTKWGVKRLIEELKKIDPDRKRYFVITAGNKNYPLNDDNLDSIIKTIGEENMVEADVVVSDTTGDIIINSGGSLQSIELKELGHPNKLLRRQYKKDWGEFWKFGLDDDFIDLSPLQVYKWKQFRAPTIKSELIPNDKEEHEGYKGCVNGKDKIVDFDANIKEINYENCLTNSLKQLFCDPALITELKTIGLSNKFPQSQLNKVCEKLKIRINLHKYDEKSKMWRYKMFGKDGDIYRIGLLENHYFPILKHKITKYAIQNFRHRKPKDKKWFLRKNIDRYDHKAEMESHIVLKYLLDDIVSDNPQHILGELKLDDAQLLKTKFKHELMDEVSLCYDEKKCIKYYEHSNREKPNRMRVFFDYETFNSMLTLDPNSRKRKVVPYMLCAITEDGRKFYWDMNMTATDGAWEFFKWLENDIGHDDYLLIAHNAGFDYRHLLHQFHSVKNYIPKGSSGLMFMAGSRKIGDRKFNYTIHDSWKKITIPLSKFGATFGLDQAKSVFPYSAITGAVVAEKLVSYDYCVRHLKFGDEKHFRKYATPFITRVPCGTIKNEMVEMVDIMAYSRYYCELDCKVLKDGYEKFRDWFLDDERINIDIDDHISLASIAQQYLHNEGCYVDVALLGGIVQMFIQRCVVGGRTMTRRNKKVEQKYDPEHPFTHDTISDFDAVSLYPSAMVRMLGFLKGAPDVWTGECISALNEKDGYFLKIKLLRNAPRKLDFPLLSKINDKGVREFTNKTKDEYFYVDKTTLQDVMEFHGFAEKDIEIEKGYIFNNGRNPKVRESIKYLFDKRLEMKEEENPAQIVYKLMMNSSYGKSIQKEYRHDYKIKSQNEIETYVIHNFNNIEYHEELPHKNDATNYLNVVKVEKCMNEHFNYAQVGTEVLSMSKRIMNEVMCLAENHALEMYYQDTDSIHIQTRAINRLAQLYKEKYDRELIGKELGQFHSDFELKTPDGKNCKNVVSIHLYAVGKKMYSDKLVGEYEGKKYYGFHTRCKGTSRISWDFKIDEKNKSRLGADWNENMRTSFIQPSNEIPNENYINEHDIMGNIFAGEKEEFDMLCGGIYKYGAVNFNFHKSLDAFYNPDFTRTIQVVD